MGNRANIYIKDAPETGVWLYTHWEGYRLPAVLQSALKRHQRWDDSQYLSRIIFCEMVKDKPEGETGYGISSQPCDGGYTLLIVNTGNQTVSLGDGRYGTTPIKSWGFTDYCALEMKDGGWEVLSPEEAE